MTLVLGAKEKDGTFSYEVWNGPVMIEAGKGYPSRESAHLSAHVCYRELHRRNFIWNEPFLQNDYMTFDEIMAELDMPN